MGGGEQAATRDHLTLTPLHVPQFKDVLVQKEQNHRTYEFLRLLAEKGIPMPRQLVVSGFPAPTIDEKERPWNRNAPMDDPAFQNECRGWNVNEVVFTPGNWKTYAPMM